MNLAPALAWFTRHPADQIAAEQARLRSAEGGRREPVLTTSPAAEPQPPALPPPASTPADEQAFGRSLRNISPREFADLMHELYLGGVLSWEEYRMVGFPSQLHPRFDETIGALTGERAAPDTPQDMLGEWERRVDFERRRSVESPETAARAERILEVLRWQGQKPVSMEV